MRNPGLPTHTYTRARTHTRAHTYARTHAQVCLKEDEFEFDTDEHDIAESLCAIRGGAATAAAGASIKVCVCVCVVLRAFVSVTGR